MSNHRNKIHSSIHTIFSLSFGFYTYLMFMLMFQSQLKNESITTEASGSYCSPAVQQRHHTAVISTNGCMKTEEEGSTVTVLDSYFLLSVVCCSLLMLQDQSWRLRETEAFCWGLSGRKNYEELIRMCTNSTRNQIRNMY